MKMQLENSISKHQKEPLRVGTLICDYQALPDSGGVFYLGNTPEELTPPMRLKSA